MSMLLIPPKAVTQVGLFLRQESAQDVFEYVLIIDAASLAILVAAAVTVPGLFSAVASGVCDAINTAGNMVCSIS